MSDGIREELQALLFDSAPPADVDGEALFARTFASEEGAGADLLPPDGLFDLPADDPADDLGAVGEDAGGNAGEDAAAFDGTPPVDGTGAVSDDDGAGVDTAAAEPWGDPAGDDPAGGAPDAPFEPGAGW